MHNHAVELIKTASVGGEMRSKLSQKKCVAAALLSKCFDRDRITVTNSSHYTIYSKSQHDELQMLYTIILNLRRHNNEIMYNIIDGNDLSIKLDELYVT